MRSTSFFTVLVMLAVTWAAPIHRTEISSQSRSQDLGVRTAVPYPRRDLFERRDVFDFEEDVLDRRDLLDIEGVLNRRDWLDIEDDLVYRRQGSFDDELIDLFRRAGKSSEVNEVIKAQGQKIVAADKKKYNNGRLANKANQAAVAAIPKPVAPKLAGMDPTAAKSARVAYDQAKDDRAKAGEKAAAQAMTQARNDLKADRQAMWAARKGKPGPKVANQGTPRTQLEKQADRATRQASKQAKSAELQAAGQRLKTTQNLPGRTEGCLVPNAKNANDKSVKEISGKDVRQAVFNAYANQRTPVGQAGKEQPKQYNNAPYDPSHPDPNLQGKPTIPGLAAGKGVEYPVFANSPMGWTGEQPAGTARIITEDGRPDTFHGVIAHDLTRKGAAHDHYLVQKKP